MKKRLSKENFILLYLTFITGIYPILLIPSKIQSLIVVSRYQAVLLHYIFVFIFFFIVPAIILKYFYHEKLLHFGLNFHHFSKGLKFVGVLLPILFLMIFFSAKTPEIINEYPLAKVQSISLFIIMEFFYLLYYIGWEFLFRGMILCGIQKYSIVLLLVLSTIPSTLLHYSKPDGEIVLAIIAGFVLGYYVYKYKTIWFAVFLHWCVGILMDILVLWRNT